MAELSESLNSTFEKMKSNSREEFRIADVSLLKERLKKSADGYACLRCDNASWLIQWIPADPLKKGREFGTWADPHHVGCKAFLSLPNFETAPFFGFHRPHDTDFYCSAEVNGSAGAADANSSQRTRAQLNSEREKQEEYRRESDRG